MATLLQFVCELTGSHVTIVETPNGADSIVLQSPTEERD